MGNRYEDVDWASASRDVSLNSNSLMSPDGCDRGARYGGKPGSFSSDRREWACCLSGHNTKAVVDMREE